MIFIQPSIDPVIISLGFLDIRWYSMAYIVAFLLGLYLIKFFNKKKVIIGISTVIIKTAITLANSISTSKKRGLMPKYKSTPNKGINKG